MYYGKISILFGQAYFPGEEHEPKTNTAIANIKVIPAIDLYFFIIIMFYS